MSAQERDLDVLDIEITKEESDMLKENPAASPSDGAGERGRSKKKETSEPPKRSEEE